VSFATSRLYGSGDHPVPRQRRLRSGSVNGVPPLKAAAATTSMLMPRSPCPAATDVRFSSPPPAVNSNLSPLPLSSPTHASVISSQPSPGLPASQVTVVTGHLLGE